MGAGRVVGGRTTVFGWEMDKLGEYVMATMDVVVFILACQGTVPQAAAGASAGGIPDA